MMKVMMGSAPAGVYASKLQAGGVAASVGSPILVQDGVVQGLPAQADGISYLVSSPVATALQGSGRTDIWRLPPDASSNAPASFGLDYLIKVV